MLKLRMAPGPGTEGRWHWRIVGVAPSAPYAVHQMLSLLFSGMQSHASRGCHVPALAGGTAGTLSLTTTKAGCFFNGVVSVRRV